MAYGVKYRLDFSDLKENKKRLEILKDGYSGSVLPMVGAGEPIEITWNVDDNIYSPIIGSRATVNLLVTDSVSYDNFYEFDEREYQVKLSYWDGAAYQTYWIGWLTVDSFTESITSTPYQISLSALDGLGTLSKYETPMYDSGSSEPIQRAKPPINYFADILANLGLGLSIYTSNELITTTSTAQWIYEYLWSVLSQSSDAAYGFIKNNKIQDAKKTLVDILEFTHSRLFQSYGRWYIINASGYSEQSIKDDLLNSTFSGSSVQDEQNALLIANETENIKYRIFNSSGVYQSDSTVDVLSIIPTDLTPIGNDLVKEYTRPLDNVSLEYNLTHNLFLAKGNYRFFWDNGNASNIGWKTSNTCAFSQDEVIYDNSIKFSGSSGILESYTDGYLFSGNNYKLELKAFTNATSQQLDVTIRCGDGVTGYKYYVFGTDTWSDTAAANNVSLTKQNEWETITEVIENPPYSYPYIKITAPNSTTSNFVYLGEILWTRNDFESTGFDKQTRTLTRNSGEYTGDLTLNELSINNQIDYEYTLGGTTIGFRRPYDVFYGGNKDLGSMRLQYILNDHRDNLKKYTGTLYNNSTAPISLHNKIWVNYGSSLLQEPVSCYIDGMTYSVKSNAYDVSMHVPNQDNDISATIAIKNT